MRAPRIEDLIKEGDVLGIKEVMEKSAPMGMQTFDMALYKLYNSGKISLDEALKNADGENNLRLKIELAEKGNNVSGDDDEDDKFGLSLIQDEEDEEDEENGFSSFSPPDEKA